MITIVISTCRVDEEAKHKYFITFGGWKENTPNVNNMNFKLNNNNNLIKDKLKPP